MAMSDCERCWNTTCTCGYDYRDYSRSQRVSLAAVILGVSVEDIYRMLSITENHPRKEV